MVKRLKSIKSSRKLNDQRKKSSMKGRRHSKKKTPSKHTKSKKGYCNAKNWFGKAPLVRVGKYCAINRPEGIYKMSQKEAKEWKKLDNDPDEMSNFFKKLRREGSLYKL